MFHFFKKKPVTLTFFTTHYGLPDVAPLRPVSKAIPEWWKKTPAYNTPEEVRKALGRDPNVKIPKRELKTVKHCYSVQKTIEKAIAFPMWCEQEVSVFPDGRIQGTAPNQKSGGTHHKIQYPNAIGDDWVNFKFDSPWVAYTDKPVSFYMTDAFCHNKEKTWQVMPGVVEFYYQHHTNINTIMRKPNGQQGFEYEFGVDEIMAYYIPMFDDELIIKNEVVSPEELNALEFGRKIWFNPASAARKNDIGGCPFHRKK